MIPTADCSGSCHKQFPATATEKSGKTFSVTMHFKWTMPKNKKTWTNIFFVGCNGYANVCRRPALWVRNDGLLHTTINQNGKDWNQ